MQTKRLVVLFVLMTLVLGLGVGAMTASARTNRVITVNSTAGSYNPFDGKCTLREAINNANNDSNTLPWSPDCAAGSGADTIELGAGQSYIFTVVDSGVNPDENAVPVITSEMTINGHGSTIERKLGSVPFRIIDINFSGNLTLNDVTLRNGIVYSGGRILGGGAIRNRGTLILNNSVVQNNLGQNGGGISNESIARITNTQIIENTTFGGGDLGNGAGIYNTGDLKLDHVTIQSNDTGTGAGGGLFSKGKLTLTDSTFATNYAGLGAGIYLSDTTGQVLIQNSTLDHNAAIQRGGGIYTRANMAIVTLANNTIAYNKAQKGSGLFVQDSAVVVVNNNTIRYNESTADYILGAQVHASNASFFMQNSIVSYAFGGPNCYTESGGSIVNLANNLEDGASCGWDSNNGSQSLGNVNLGPLQFNGGTTQTMLPLAGSDAIDKGNDAVCAAGPISNRDQRGYVRPAGAHCDVGAVESEAGLPTPTATHTPTSTNTPLPAPTNTPTATSTTSPSCMTAPAAPTLAKPNQNAMLTKRRVNLNWSDVPCAVSYEVEVHGDSKTGVLADSATGLSVSQFQTKALARGKTYFWRASACNVHGCTASGWRKFSITP